MRDGMLEATYDCDGVQVSAALDARGRELPDPVPLAPPVSRTSADTLIEMIRRTVRQEFSALAADQGFETFEEAEDFDCEGDPLDELTPYEAVFEPPAAPAVPDGPGSPAPPGGSTVTSAEGAPGKEASREGAPTPPSAPPASSAPLGAGK